MPGLVENVDPDGLYEYSVVYTDRSLNHMSKEFQSVMKELSERLKRVYNGVGVAIVPGGGSYGMETIARQFATNQTCLVVRNGYFSFRWTQIFETCKIPEKEIVLKARQIGEGAHSPFAPPPIEEVVETILREKPSFVGTEHHKHHTQTPNATPTHTFTFTENRPFNARSV